VIRPATNGELVKSMTEVQREAGRIARLMGRGRSESTPFWVHTSVLLVIAVVAAILILLAFAARQLV
jgi:ABC-type microcin C transport system permease subunit YejE